MNSHTAPLTAEQVEKLRGVLEGQGFGFVEKPYTVYAAKRGKLSVNVYEKGPKVLVQGKETAEFVEFTLEPEITGVMTVKERKAVGNLAGMYEPHFGIDESGKGDFFGPLVVAGVYTDGQIARELIKRGVTDSKKINTPKKIRELASVIKGTPGVFHDVIALRPEKYNEIYGTFKNLNSMLAWGHSTVIEKLLELKPDCPRALSDQFARKQVLEEALRKKAITVELEQRTKGEADTAVAAASILARERFIDWMDAATRKVGFKIPLGASPQVVEAGRRLVEEHGVEVLGKFAKLHFKTTGQVV